jgi:hypothetical protein
MMKTLIFAAAMLAASQAQAADKMLAGTWCEIEVQTEAEGWSFFKRGKCADDENKTLVLKPNGDYILSNFAHEMVCKIDPKSYFKGWADYTCTFYGGSVSKTKLSQKFTFDGRILGLSNIDLKK